MEGNSAKKFQCAVCLKYFGLKGNLKTHMTLHTGQKTYECTICQKPFRTKVSRARHEETHSNDKPYRCPVCDKSFKSKVGFEEHQRDHTGEKPYQCSKCNQRFNRKSRYSVHMRDHKEQTAQESSKQVIVPCPTLHMEAVPKKRTSPRSILPKPLVLPKASEVGQKLVQVQKSHCNSHVHQLAFKCSECPLAFILKLNLVKHTKVNAGKEMCSCSICQNDESSEKSPTIQVEIQPKQVLVHQRSERQKSFKKGHFLGHMKRHTTEKSPQNSEQGKSDQEDPVDSKTETTEDKPFQCLECHKSFKRMDLVTTHMKVHLKDKPYKCFECIEAFEQEAEFLEHQKIHELEKPFSCTVCNQSFKLWLDLKAHTKIHRFCSVCQKSFQSMTAQRSHARIHTGERPFECSVCDKTFRRNGTLKQHMKIHMEEKSLRCKKCHRLFREKGSLVCHMKVHMKEKTLLSPEVSERVEREKYSVNHNNNSTRVQVYRCAECPKTFLKRGNYREHIRRVHLRNKPFQCLECLRCFKKAKELEVHLQVHIGKKPPFQCCECNKLFRLRSSLRKHLQVHKIYEPVRQSKRGKQIVVEYCDKSYFSKHRDFSPHDEEDAVQVFDSVTKAPYSEEAGIDVQYDNRSTEEISCEAADDCEPDRVMEIVFTAEDKIKKEIIEEVDAILSCS